MSAASLGALFWSRVSSSGGRVAHRIKVEGAWREVSWQALGGEVRDIALGLIALGRQPGDAVGILSQSRTEWVRADFAILSIGCITIPVYPTYPPESLPYSALFSGIRPPSVDDEHKLETPLAAATCVPNQRSATVRHGG